MKRRPEYYRQGDIEPWDFIVSQDLGFLEGNIIKYITRAGKKEGESKMDDLLKAATYIRKLIETTSHEDTTSRPDDAGVGVPSSYESTDCDLSSQVSNPSGPSDFRGVSRVP